MEPIEPMAPADGLPPTEAMPVAAGAPPVDPPVDPPAGDEPGGSWYENRGAVAALVAVGLVLVFLLIGWLTWWSGDDDEDATLGTADIVDASTVPTIETTVPETTVPETTVPETTVPETTVPETTAPPTTVPETTAPETTVPETTAPGTTVPETTTPPGGSVPDITVPEGGGSLVDILTGNPDLSIVWGLVQESGLDAVLTAAPGPYTIFAPTNDAFEGVTPPTGQELTSLISLHVVIDSLDSAGVLAAESLPSLAGPTLAVDADAGTVGGAKILVVDLEGTEAPVGYIHVVDAIVTGS
jgi:Fasciclin domain